jgi:hypothetical protein
MAIRPANNSVLLYGRFNNDSGANYDFNEVQAGVSTSAAAAQNQMRMGNNIPNTATYAHGYSLLIPNYTNTTLYKSMVCVGGYATSGAQSAYHGIQSWRSTTAINRVDIFYSAGNIDTGSRIALFGVTNS